METFLRSDIFIINRTYKVLKDNNALIQFQHSYVFLGETPWKYSKSSLVLGVVTHIALRRRMLASDLHGWMNLILNPIQSDGIQPTNKVRLNFESWKH